MQTPHRREYEVVNHRVSTCRDHCRHLGQAETHVTRGVGFPSVRQEVTGHPSSGHQVVALKTSHNSMTFSTVTIEEPQAPWPNSANGQDFKS